MKELTEAINSQLAALYGVENVYAGFASDATIPYQTYVMQPSGPSEYHAADHNEGTIATYPVLINIFSRTYTQALSRVEEIVQSFEDTFPEMENDKCLNVETISQHVEQESVREETGPVVWRGMAVIEFTVSRGR